MQSHPVDAKSISANPLRLFADSSEIFSFKSAWPLKPVGHSGENVSVDSNLFSLLGV